MNELSEDDRVAFQALDTAEDMVGSIEQYIEHLNSQRTSRLLGACKKISQFGKAIEPFFKIIDIFISSHPDWAAIFWGAIRMVFQVRLIGRNGFLVIASDIMLAEQPLCGLLREASRNVFRIQ